MTARTPTVDAVTESAAQEARCGHCDCVVTDDDPGGIGIISATGRNLCVLGYNHNTDAGCVAALKRENEALRRAILHLVTQAEPAHRTKPPRATCARCHSELDGPPELHECAR